VDEHAWEKSVEQVQIVPGLTVHDVGLSVYGETRSLRDRQGSNESIGVARQKIAHVIINGAELAQQTGKKRPVIHPAVEPSKKTLTNSGERSAYESSLRAAREAYLSGSDPTNGAVHFYLAKTPSRANQIYSSENKNGVPISSQSGPYGNSYPQGDAGSRTIWVNTYMPDENDKRIRRSHPRKP
jgi:hypothetical protein